MKLNIGKSIQLIGSAIVPCALLGAINLGAQSVTFSSGNLTDGYMSWVPTAYTTANYPGDGGSGASGWGLSALPATFSGNTLTLSPNVNTYAPGVTYWVNPDGSGANQMDGAIYNETTGVYVGTSVTFSFDVLANTLATGYSADAFIKDFGPGYAYNGEQTVNLTPGVDSVTYALTGNNPGEIVQFGFELIGPDANPATVASLGSVEIAPVPEPTTMALAGLGLLGVLGSRLRRRI
ncbi:MAG TPA: PEP-CTERM sorting domain-containing protein [Verrucomicrobiae bacterium]|nr:PEP-CTERM sorting domain-containing protein [Verrucomicrobiae bacterium]